MRRPFAVIGFSSFFVCLGCIYFNVSFAKAILIASAVALLLTFAIKQTRKLSIIYVLFATMLISSVLCLHQFDKIDAYNEKYCSKKISLKATLIDEPELGDKTNFYTFRTEDENKVKFNISTARLLDVDIGDSIEGKFEFTNEFASYSQGIYFSTYLNNYAKITIIDNPETFNLVSLRREISSIIDEHLTQGQGLTKAILFGDKTEITDKEYVDLLKCGLLHATATSGLHLSIVSGFVFFLLSLCFFSRKASSIISIVFVVLFMLVVGFRYSLVRAGIMTTVCLLANVFDRESDGVNSIGLAVFVIICINPYCVVDCSFLLSVAATLGLILALSPLSDKLNEIEFGNHTTIKKLTLMFLGTALQSAIATLFTLPIAYLYFGYVSTIGVLVNAIVSPFITFILISGLLLILLSFVPYAPFLIADANDFVCSVFLKVIDWFSQFRYCLISIDYWFVPWIIVATSVCISVAIFVFYCKKPNKSRVIKLTSLIVANFTLVFMLINICIPSSTVKITIQKSSSSILIYAFVDEKAICIDTGTKDSSKVLNRQLVYNSCDEIDTLIQMDSSQKGSESIKQVTQKCKVNTLICAKSITNYKNVKEYKNIDSIKCVDYAGLHIEIFHQGSEQAVFISYKDSSMLVVDGFMDFEKMPKKYLSTNLLILDDIIPYNINSIKTQKAIVCTYNPIYKNYLARHMDCYSLIDEYRLDVVMCEKLKIEKR